MAKQSKVSKIISVLLVIALFAGAFAGISILLKKSLEGVLPDSMFFVKIADKTIFSTVSGYVVNNNNPLTVEVKKSLLNDDKANYTVTIDADSELSFSYVKDGKVNLFKSSVDVSDFFVIVDNEKGFVLTAKGSSVTEMLNILNDGSSISVDEKYIDYKKTMFWLTITSKDDVQSFVKIGFSINTSPVIVPDEIVLDQKEIIF